MRNYAYSFQTPRSLAGYRKHLARDGREREGFLEVKCVENGFNPASYDWIRCYVVLRDAAVFCCESSEGLEEELVNLEPLVLLEDVLSVKTTHSLQNKTIIALSTASMCVYIYTPREDVIKDWLFCFHTAFSEFLLGDDSSSLFHRSRYGSSPSTRGLRHVPTSADHDHRRDGFPWYSSSGDCGDLESRGLVMLGDSPHFEEPKNLFELNIPKSSDDDSRSSNARELPIKSESLSRGGIGSLIENSSPSFGQANEEVYSSTSLGRIATREFSVPLISNDFRPVSSGGVLPASPFAGDNDGSRNYSEHQPKSVLQGSPLDPFCLCRTPTESSTTHFVGSMPFAGFSPASGSLSRLENSGPIISSKRVHNPPLELQSELLSPVSVNSSKPFAIDEKQTILTDHIPQVSGEKYVPPHLRRTQFSENYVDFESSRDLSSKEKIDKFGVGLTPTGEQLKRSHGFHDVKHRSNSYSKGDGDDLMFFEMESGPMKGSFQDSRHHHTQSETMLADSHDDSSFIRRRRKGSESSVFGRVSEQGYRATMEDYDVAIPRFKERPHLGFYAVYDGHCGSLVAELAMSRMHEFCLEDDRFGCEWPVGSTDAVNKAFNRVEEDFFGLVQSNTQKRIIDGSCAIVALVHYPAPDSWFADSVAVANLGDSRAIAFCNGEIHVLSEEHTPARPNEKSRIEEAGGWVTVEREMLVEKLHRVDLSDPLVKDRVKKRFNYVETHRVNGELSVSRALGDMDYKNPAQNTYQWFFPVDHEGYGKEGYEFANDLVLSEPEWKHLQLEPMEEVNGDTDPSFLIIACDGLWDVVSNEEAIEICLECRSPQMATDALLDMAMRMGTVDNVTILVVALRPWVWNIPSCD